MATVYPRVPNPSVAITDPQTGLMTKDWYTYLASLHLALTTVDGSTLLQDFVDDAAATAGGIPRGGLYRTGSIIKIRVT
jgi:hypothetical protein